LVYVKRIALARFDLLERPEKRMMENECINFKGRKLVSLETMEMKLTLKPKKKEKFAFMEKVQYIDEIGECKSFGLKQLTVTVKEWGIRGWLRGPD